MARVSLGPLNTLPDAFIALRELANSINDVYLLVTTKAKSSLPVKAQDVVFVGPDGRWARADRGVKERAPVTGYGIALGSGINFDAQVASVVGGFVDLVPGSTYYLGNEGAITLDTAGPIVVALGTAISPTSLLFQPEYLGDL